MLTFTLDPRCGWIVRSCGRNPLIRLTDRVEALVVMFAIIVSLGAGPVAGAVGTAVYGARHQLYAEEAQTRHPGAAVLSGLTPAHDSGPAGHARWSAADAGNPAKAAQASDVWVGNDGKQVNAPTPTSRAAANGKRTGVPILLTVVAAAATLVVVAHWRMDRMRDGQWERELRCLADDDGGRDDRSYG